MVIEEYLLKIQGICPCIIPAESACFVKTVGTVIFSIFILVVSKIIVIIVIKSSTKAGPGSQVLGYICFSIYIAEN